MDLMILNPNLDVVSILDSYESLIWTDRYHECGDFEIYTPVTAKILSEIKKDCYLQISESEHTMIVDGLLIESDTENGNHVTFTGKSLEFILDRRIIWGLKTLTGNLQNAIKTLLNECIISPSDSRRKISNFLFEASTDPAITKLTIDAQYTGANLYEVIVQICKEHNIGFKVILNDKKQFVFKLYAGADRSYDNAAYNPYVVFSPNFGNINSSNYIESKSALRNVALIGGEGEGPDRRYATLGSESGLNRRELFVDARDISSDIGDGVVLTDVEYAAQLNQRGREKLDENMDVTCFEGEAEVTGTFKYGEDFFIGDIVQIEDEYGHAEQSQILEVVISESTAGKLVYPTFRMTSDMQ